MDSSYIEQLQPKRFPSPCFVTDLAKLKQNAAILDSVQQRTGARIMLALKGFAQWHVFPLLSRAYEGPLYGCCASSPDEAHLAREEFGGEVHAFAAAWSQRELAEVLRFADHIVFNSLAQWREFRPVVAQWNATATLPITCGLRLNPEHSEGAVPIYDPCSAGSRLGIRPAEILAALQNDSSIFQGLDGLHFHTLCEQDADALARTYDAVESKFRPLLTFMQQTGQLRWLNFGGGHHITRPDYDIDLLCRVIERARDTWSVQVYLEPGEAVALNAGVLIATVLDIVQADMPIAILDTSAACHMPDVLEMPYRPNIIGSCEAHSSPAMPHTYRLAGKSCLAGDVIGEYAFPAPLSPGDRLVFTDMAIYSMVKTTTFNGLRLPSIAVWNPIDDSYAVTRSFGYEDFKGRLS